MELRWAVCALMLAAWPARATEPGSPPDPGAVLNQWRPFQNDPLDRLKTAADGLNAHWADLRVAPIMDVRGREVGGKLDASLPARTGLFMQGDVDVIGDHPELKSGVRFANGASVEALSKAMARPELNLKWQLGAKTHLAARMDTQRSSAGASLQYAFSPLWSAGADVSRVRDDSRFMLRLSAPIRL